MQITVVVPVTIEIMIPLIVIDSASYIVIANYHRGSAITSVFWKWSRSGRVSIGHAARQEKGKAKG